MGIKLKIFIYTMTVILVLTSAIAFFNVKFQKDVLYTEKIEDIRFFINGFGISIKESLISKDYSRIDNYVKELKLSEKINDINIYDENGVIVGSNNLHNLNKKTIDSHIVNIFKSKNGIVYIRKNEIIIAEPVLVRNIMYGIIEIKLPVTIITAVQDSYFKNILYFLIFAFFAGIILSYTLASGISKKINMLIEVSKSLASCDFKQEVKFNSSDEFGELSKIFNKMIFNMKIMFNVIKKINFSTPSDELLDVIMDNITMAIGAERISILYYSEEDNALKLNKVRGLDEDIIDTGIIRPGEGIAGKVFESGIPMIANKGFMQEDFKKFENSKWRDEKIKNIMCVPIEVEGKIVGVINIINKNSPNGFDEFDLKLLQALIVHISQAISRSSLYNETITDGLTGLYIKKYFYSRLEEEAFRARRYGQDLSVIYIDIDDFDDLNKKCGSLECDIFLMHLGRILKNNIRLNIDIPARLGGDEFAVILPETDEKKGMLFADRLRKKIEDFIFLRENGETAKLTVSISFAKYDADDDLPRLIVQLEEAMKISKSKGKNRVTLFEKI